MKLELLHNKIFKLHRILTEEIVEIIPTTTQQSFSPTHPSLTTPYNKNFPFPQLILQSTVEPAVVPKYSQIEYQT